MAANRAEQVRRLPPTLIGPLRVPIPLPRKGGGNIGAKLA